MKYTIEELNEKYDLELDKVVAEVGKKKAKLVLLQFPDGLKVYATAVVDYLREKTKAEYLVWLGSCFGACDTPNLGNVEKDVDMVIQFGHSQKLPNF